MTKRKNSISINIVSVLIVLMSLFIGVVGKTNAWFTAEHKNGVEIVVQVGALSLSLYQRIDESTTNLVYSYAENAELAEANKKYVQFNGRIIPDVPNTLHLYIANDDPKSVPMYVRYKFEIFARGETYDTEIPVQIEGFIAWSASQAGMKFDESSGFYYYKSADGNNALLEKSASQVLMTSFKINYSDMVDASGNLKFASSESIYIKLTVEGSAVGW